MNKTIKIIITVSVFTLIVLYFLRACEGRTIVHGTDCERFNSTLLTKTEEYFMNNLPLEDGDMKVATVDDLISENYLTISDLSKVGTSCTGNVFVGKSGTNYYYSSNVVCGTCSTGDLYTEWSDYQDTLPNLINKNSQVQVGMFYNYGTEQLKFSDWSDWALTLDAIKEPQIPAGTSIVDTEKEEKTQYSYRDGSFKWYKLIQSILEYYGNGKYYEAIPAAGYTKDTQTKKVSRTEISQSKSELTSKLTGLEYSPITTTPGYILQTPEYIYSYVKSTQTCSAYKAGVRCYKIPSQETYESSYVYSSSSNALSVCNNNPDAIDCKTLSKTTKIYGCPDSTWTLIGSKTSSESQCMKTTTQASSLKYIYTCPNPTNFWTLVGTVCRSTTYVYYVDGIPKCGKGTYNSTGKYCWVSATATKTYVCPTGYSPPSSPNPTTCSKTEIQNSSLKSSETLYAYQYKYNVIETPSGGKYDWDDAAGGIVASGTCPSNYPLELSMGKNICTDYSTTNTTYYLKKDGTEVTDLSKAEYISETDFAKLGKTSYSKDTSKVKYTPAATYKEGNCPSGTNSSNCSAISLYKAYVYSYKWYKTSSAEKTWYNNGEYLAKSPGSGYQADTATAKWGSWSEFSDKEVKASSTMEVKTQILKRIRKSYLIFDKLYFPEFLPLDEFEKQTGKTLAELSKDTKITIVKKVMYKYRTLK